MRLAASSPLARTVHWLALLALCGAYLQGSICKLLDFTAARAEMVHFHLAPPALFAAAVIAMELTCSALILSGKLRWLGALVLAAFTFAANFLANAWWNAPPGPAASMLMNGFFEHLGLVGAFVLVALLDLEARREAV